ncbi:AraC family transcriptional regulator [Novosphingobium beihaiensis]|uniref:AraC family transcriptional regulator n=1 Tax=Novosphingobium beihaiensis TaxID=2930389 RepID=A0ABT0BN39_9SPHN|nr:AraC family transcriptional regulator [Novosphingobium beihaiensis]MCJ2186472.1 AraC family transcriptional regulator [Novosphingobium beihaiensis]
MNVRAFLSKVSSKAAARIPEPLNLLPDPIARLPARAGMLYFYGMEELLIRMRERVLGHAPGPDGATAVPNLFLAVSFRRTVPAATLNDPMICVVLQGVKEVLIGGHVLRFQPASCFASTIELPAMGSVLEADAEKPYIAVALKLDHDALAALVGDIAPEQKRANVHSGFRTAPATADLLEAIERLLMLLEQPEDISALGAGREREVLYRLLQSGHGDMLRQAIQQGNGFGNIRRSIAWIRQNLDQSLRTEMLASIAGMSVPSFHRHFKAATSMSPLQYQKTLRLQAARRLLVTSTDTTRAAYAVGYESASQFSREYSRLFGLPPSRDAARMQAASNGPVEYVF